MKNVLKQKNVYPVMLCLLIAAAYSPTFSGDFILDDRPFVKENAYIREFHGAISLLSQEDGITGEASGQYHSGYYRPFVTLSYILDFKLWGMHPGGFRATNLILHLATCLLLFHLMNSLTTGGPGPFIAVLFFGLHPANTESVSWIASRNNILVTFFCLASLAFYGKRVIEGRRWAGPASLLCFAVALLCKEFAVVLLPILLLYDRFGTKQKRPYGERIWGYLAFVAILLSYMYLRMIVLQDLMPPRGEGHLGRALFFVPYVILYNLRIAFLPVGLHNFMVSYPGTYLGAEAIAGFAGSGLLGWLIWRRRAQGMLVFSFLSFAVALFPVLHIIPTSAYSLVAMRWLYFPLSLLSFSLPIFLGGLSNKKRSITNCLLLGAGLLYMGTYSLVLNGHHWKKAEDFFRNEVILFGNLFYAGDYAKTLYDEGNYGEASKYFRIAARTTPDKAVHAVNHAALLVKRGEPQKALDSLERAETLRLTLQNRSILHNNRGAAFFMMGEYENALKSFLLAVRFDPKASDPLLNLGRTYSAMGRHEEAIAVFERCLDLDMDPDPVWKMLGITYAKMGDHARALEWLGKIP